MRGEMCSQVRLGEEVERVEWGEEGCTVVTRGRRVRCEHAVVTIPLGVLQARHGQVAGHLTPLTFHLIICT